GRVAGIEPSAIWDTLDRLSSSIPPEGRADVAAEIERCRRERSDLHIEPQLITTSGADAWIEIRAQLMEEGRERFVGVYLDVTERKRAEQELRRARDAADEANQAK